MPSFSKNCHSSLIFAVRIVSRRKSSRKRIEQRLLPFGVEKVSTDPAYPLSSRQEKCLHNKGQTAKSKYYGGEGWRSPLANARPEAAYLIHNVEPVKPSVAAPLSRSQGEIRRRPSHRLHSQPWPSLRRPGMRWSETPALHPSRRGKPRWITSGTRAIPSSSIKG